MTKTDLDNPTFKGIVLASPGIGKKYLERIDVKRNKYKEWKSEWDKTDETYSARAEQIAQQWRRIRIEGGNYELNKARFETEADKIYQQLDLEKWKLNNEEQKIVKDYILGILQSGVQMYKY